MKELTLRQHQVLDFLIQTTEEGRQATITELVDTLGLHSKQGVHEHMRRLEVYGYIELAQRSSRGCRILCNLDGSPYLTPLERYHELARALGCSGKTFEETLAAARAKRVA